MSMVKTPQQEIWAFSPPPSSESSGTWKPAVPPEVLITPEKVTASLRGTNTPRPRSIDDDDNANPDLLRDFAWSPDHASLLLMSADTLAWYDIDTHKSRILVHGDEPVTDAVISPDGKTVSFVRNHSLWTVSVSAGTMHALTPAPVKAGILQGELDWPYRNELHMARGYAWSPDSSRIAYLETDDRAVEKYSIRSSSGDTRQITYPKPGGALPSVRILVKTLAGGLAVELRLPEIANKAKGFYLPRFTWLPDSRTVAIERLDRRQQTLELFLADTVTGKARLILSESDKYWINLADDLRFLADGRRFLWSSERTGYRHLYLYDTDGKQLAQLTHGEWEVTGLNAVDEAHQRIYFTATEKSPLERHLYSVGYAGEELHQITQQPGTHEAHIAPNGSSWVDSYSTQTTAPRWTWAALDSPSTPGPNTSTELFSPAPIANLQRAEFVTFKLHMGTEVHGFLLKPPSFDPKKKYPVIVYLAGGPGEQLVRDAWGGANGLWMQYMAQQGYIVYALDNQGTAGRGHYFEEPLHFRLSSQEMIDQRDGLIWLTDLPYVDSSRLGVCGWGYGGFLVTHAMMLRPVAFKAGFAGAPIVDWSYYDAVFGERYLDDPVAYQDGWLASVSLENAKYFKGPLMVAQGTADEYVHVENVLTMQDHLLDAGKSASLLLLPDRGHTIEDAPARLVVFQSMSEFFLKNL